MAEYIDRNAAIAACFDGFADCRDDCAANIRNIPAADVVERKRGKWLDDGLDGIGVMGIEYRWQKCSECGSEFSKAHGMAYPKYCSQCGAKMEVLIDV